MGKVRQGDSPHSGLPTQAGGGAKGARLEEEEACRCLIRRKVAVAERILWKVANRLHIWGRSIFIRCRCVVARLFSVNFFGRAKVRAWLWMSKSMNQEDDMKHGLCERNLISALVFGGREPPCSACCRCPLVTVLTGLEVPVISSLPPVTQTHRARLSDRQEVHDTSDLGKTCAQTLSGLITR